MQTVDGFSEASWMNVVEYALQYKLASDRYFVYAVDPWTGKAQKGVNVTLRQADHVVRATTGVDGLATLKFPTQKQEQMTLFAERSGRLQHTVFSPRGRGPGGSGGWDRYSRVMDHAMTDRPVRILAGGSAAWRAAGGALGEGFENMADDNNDVQYKAYDHTENIEFHMQEYLSWETGLVEQIERDGTARFRHVPV